MSIKNIFTPSLLIMFMIYSIPYTSIAREQRPPPDLFDDYGIKQPSTKTLPKKAIRGKSHKVHVHSDLLWSGSLTLNLYNDLVITATRDRLIDRVKNTTTWIGHVDGEQDSEVFLTVRGNVMSGMVRIDKDLYEIESLGSNIYEINKIDPQKNPKTSESKTIEDFYAEGGEIDGSPTISAARINSSPSIISASSATVSTGTVIDIMLVYTSKAKANASGQAGIESKLTNAVAQANQAYLNSEIDMQLNVVHIAEINYSETGDMPKSLKHLADTTDGVMDEVHRLRDQFGADQVVLVTADTNYCGISYVMENVSSNFAPFAFSVVHDDSQFACLSDQVLAHELGHGQGSQHDRDNAKTLGAYDYSYGYRLCETGGFLTIMSYGCNGGARVSYFSNPNVKLSNGLATGTFDADNARSINNTKSVVAAFRMPPDTTIPNPPSNLVATSLSTGETSITWSDASLNETGFRLERSNDGGISWNEFVVTGSNTVSFIDSGLTPSTIYHYRARSYNGNGSSIYSNIAKVTTIALNNSPCIANKPSVSLTPSNQYSKSGAALTYDISLKNQDTSSCGPTTFTLRNSDGKTLGSYELSAGTTFSTTWLTEAPTMAGSYTKFVVVLASGHMHASSLATLVVDTMPPTAPRNLIVEVGKKSELILSWNPSTDASSGLKNYVVKRNNNIVATTPGTRFIDGAKTGSIIYTVEAYDIAGNFSSSSISFTAP